MGFFGKKNYNGITKKTVEHIQLDAGAFFKNFEVGKDTYASAKEAGKLIGATSGGGEFTAKATLRQIEIDGAGARVKGLADVDSWEVSLKLTTIETTVETLKLALGTAKADTETVTGYTVIQGKTNLTDEDYIENLTWVGSITGATNPIIIQLKNGMNEDGLSYTMQDKAEGKIALTFYGYNDLSDYMEDTVAPPFEIFYPTNTESAPPAENTPPKEPEEESETENDEE